MKQRKPPRAMHAALAVLTITVPLLIPQIVSAAPTPARETNPANGTTTTDSSADSVDNYPTPTPKTFNCDPVEFGVGTECSIITVPLDYDDPAGDTTDVAYLRVPATDQENKIGTLFLNPGGPGGSGVSIAAAAAEFISPEVLEKFDILGMDPRGTNFSDNVQCFRDAGEQSRAVTVLDADFPVTKSQTQTFLDAAKAFGRACSTRGQPLSEHMATGNVARDMDVLRRVVGDEKLTYLGFSYGSYLGNVYANLYPDRVRAIAIDGIVNPVAWAGTPQTRRTPSSLRLRDGIGATAALEEILRLCKERGPQFCMFASKGDPHDNYLRIVAEVKKKPIVISDPITDEILFTLDYPALIGMILRSLLNPDAPDLVSMDLTFIHEIALEEAEPGTAESATQNDMRLALARRSQEQQAISTTTPSHKPAQAERFTRDFPYDNTVDAFHTVVCTDSADPFYVGNWPTFADRADELYGGFGLLYAWGSAPCAERTWTVRDLDSYQGPFTHYTANPVLVVGNFWDPATNYMAAQAVAKQLPHSRLLSSNNFGHTAYGTSACVTDAVNTYLLTSQVPPVGTLCESESVPFAVPLAGNGDPSSQGAVPQEMLTDDQPNPDDGNDLGLPPVVPPQPRATPQR